MTTMAEGRAARAAAIAAGAHIYIGHPCRRCGNCVRYVRYWKCQKCATRTSAAYGRKRRSQMKNARTVSSGRASVSTNRNTERADDTKSAD